MLQSVAADHTEAGKQLMVKDLGRLCYDVQQQRKTECQPIHHRCAIYRLPHRDQHKRHALQQQIQPKITIALLIGDAPPGHTDDGEKP